MRISGKSEVERPYYGPIQTSTPFAYRMRTVGRRIVRESERARPATLEDLKQVLAALQAERAE